MASVQDDTEELDIALLQLAFRPFFLLGALFSLLAMAAWLATLNGWWNEELYGGGFFWHVHEMLFGFVAAILVGFLLTAVQNWTGQRSVNGLPLAILVSLWLVARIGFMVVHRPSIWLASVDISFLVVAAALLAIPIVAVRQWRNLFFVPLLGLLALANGMMQLGLLNDDHRLVVDGAQGALGIVCVLMVTIGGRVIPAFTASGTRTPRVAPVPWLEWSALGAVWLLAALLMTGMAQQLPKVAMFVLLMFAATANLIRWFRWRFWVSLRLVLLWTLHLAYLFIIAGFAALAVSYLDPRLPAAIAWHLVTVGGMGGLILSMISRVSLGHTGRPITASGWMLPAYVCVFAAAIARTLLVEWFPGRYPLWLDIAGALWILAFAGYLACYAFVLVSPRVDGRRG